MVEYNPLQYLPTEEELPDSDDTPVDNELQILVPTLLRAILALLWTDRLDWFFGINLGVYYDSNQPTTAIVPDSFLSLGVKRFRQNGKLRLSYVVWQENNIVPQWVLEVVSKTPGSEYNDKMTKYALMGALYYTIYNSDYSIRDKHDPLEVYRLENGVYVHKRGTRVWMPEIGLGIGREVGTYEGYTREWLYWYDEQGHRFPAPVNLIEQERHRAERAEHQLESLQALLRERGIDPDTL